MNQARRIALELPASTIVRVLAVAALVWVWLQLWPLVLLMLAVAVLAVALDPVVTWLERRGIARGLGASLVGVVVLVMIVAFVAAAGSSLVSQAQVLGDRIQQVVQELARRTPEWLQRDNAAKPDLSMIGYALIAGRAVTSAAIVLTIAFILTLYLLVEGRQTYEWLLAYVPKDKRPRVHITACEARKAILAYVVGNVTTSIFAAVFVFIVLKVLHVPAALLLALLAGVADFIPVLGFVVSAAPAVLLALTVSPGTAVSVIGAYILYHFLENYFIGPLVYGEQLELSNLAVLVAFAVGAEVGGIVGALLALPAAAMYPAIERIWLQDYLGREVVETHRRLERE